ncbi:MAG: hypothetical protein ACK5LY_04730 [Lachnospirales bacterium]
MATLQNSRNGTLQKEKSNFHIFDKRLKWQKKPFLQFLSKIAKPLFFCENGFSIFCNEAIWFNQQKMV